MSFAHNACQVSEKNSSTHDKTSARFRNGSDFDSLINTCTDDPSYALTCEAMTLSVVNYKGHPYSINNRSLFCFCKARASTDLWDGAARDRADKWCPIRLPPQENLVTRVPAQYLVTATTSLTVTASHRIIVLGAHAEEE